MAATGISISATRARPNKIAAKSSKTDSVRSTNRSLLHELQMYNYDDLRMKSPSQRHKDEIASSINLARELTAYHGGLGMTETIRNMEPQDGIMLCILRRTEIELVNASKNKNTVGKQDNCIRSRRDAVRARTYLHYMRRLEIMDSEYEMMARTTARMADLREKAYTVNAEVILFDLQKHWWKMFVAANIDRRNRGDRRGIACHPTSLLALLAIEQLVRRMDQVTVWPRALERLMELAVNQDHHVQRLQSQHRWPDAVYCVAAELIERVLYTFVGEMMPEEMRYMPAMSKKREILF